MASSHVASFMERELATALKCYFAHASSLYTVYWSRPLRTFLRALLLKVLAALENGSTFRGAFELDREKAKNLADDLAKPTSCDISPEQRRLAHALLLRMQLPQCGVDVRMSPPEYDDDASWPGDLRGFEDLKASLSSHHPRGDVETYVFKLVKAFLREQPFRQLFTGFNPYANDVLYPITIEVHPNKVDSVRALIARESEALQCGGLRPSDVVKVVGVSSIAQLSKADGSEQYVLRSYPRGSTGKSKGTLSSPPTASGTMSRVWP
eukprot:m.187978 g.187978  ORF g.187978 m.187978 type:complete len:266 (+) comp10021_c1_seq26:712-1509(+)